MKEREQGLPIEHFIQALTSQLDRAQSTMALKAQAGLPLTFAVKDLTLDLRTHVEMSGSVVRIRPAGPGEAEASTIRLSLTTITRPMMEENTRVAEDPEEMSIDDVLGDEVPEDEREETKRRLEWAGVHSVSQLRELRRRTSDTVLEKTVNLPVKRLQAALARAAQPRVSRIFPEHSLSGHGTGATPLLRIRGFNLMQDGQPDVRIEGERVPVLQASDRELLVAPLPHQLAGTVSIETSPGTVTGMAFNLQPPPANGHSSAEEKP